MARKQHSKRRSKRHRPSFTHIAILVAVILLLTPFVKKPVYILNHSSIVTCLIPRTKLSLVLNEINDSLGAKNFVIIYTPCTATSCDNLSKTIIIPIGELKNKPKSIDLGRGLLDNVLIELRTRETVPPSRITSIGRHGSALLFTWLYPTLKAILYVGLEAKEATLGIQLGNVSITHYTPPRGCSLQLALHYKSQVYLLKCNSNIYAEPLVFSQKTSLLRVKQLVIRDYYCPGNGVVKEYLDFSLVLVALGLALLVLAILHVKRIKIHPHS